MTILDLMKKVDSIPALKRAVHRIHAAHSRLKEIAAEAAKESANQVEIIEENLNDISDFFGGDIKVETPELTKETVLPEFIDQSLLPSTPPKKKYEKVVALIKAAPTGLTFQELLQVWKLLEWDDWHSEKLPTHLRDAIKTARSKTINILSGGHGGKFTVK